VCFELSANEEVKNAMHYEQMPEARYQTRTQKRSQNVWRWMLIPFEGLRGKRLSFQSPFPVLLL
jgi:hypothetical protein